MAYDSWFWLRFQVEKVITGGLGTYRTSIFRTWNIVRFPRDLGEDLPRLTKCNSLMSHLLFGFCAELGPTVIYKRKTRVERCAGNLSTSISSMPPLPLFIPHYIFTYFHANLVIGQLKKSFFFISLHFSATCWNTI